MKKLVVLVVALVILSVTNVALAADGIRAEVQCHQLNLRVEPSETAPSITKLYNGQELLIVKNEELGTAYVNEFAYVEVEKNDQLYYGWVRRDLLTPWPYHLMIGETGVQVYASPSWKVKLTDEVAAGTEFMILEETDGYYVVNFREAAGFIRKSENVFLVERNNYYSLVAERGNWQEIQSEVTAYALPDKESAVVAQFSAGTSVEVVGEENGWKVILTEDERYAYVKEEDI